MAEKIVGILGGMGPKATVDFMQRIMELTPATDDIDHIRCIVDNNPKVPSRIKALIEGTGISPGPSIADMAQRLEKWGADFLVMPCNTAHYYYDVVKNSVNIPVINLIELVIEYIQHNYPKEQTLGLLASTAVVITKLYEKKCKSLGLELVYPDPKEQDRLLSVIKEVKKGNINKKVHQDFFEVCQNLKQKKVSMAIIACTELSVIGNNLPIQTVDAAQILAQEVVNSVKKKH